MTKHCRNVTKRKDETMTYEPITRIDDARTAIETLPDFSRRVFVALVAALYAEPGFTDVTSVGIARVIDAAPQAVNAALAHLYAVGVAYPDHTHVAGTRVEFVGATMHTHDNERSGEWFAFRQEMEDELAKGN
jgi:hypothetical protein